MNASATASQSGNLALQGAQAALGLSWKQITHVFDESQAKRYIAVMPNNVVARGAAIDDPDGFTGIDVLYFAQSTSADSLKDEIEWFNESNSESLPLIDYDNLRFEKTCGQIEHSYLDEVFRAVSTSERRIGQRGLCPSTPSLLQRRCKSQCSPTSWQY